MINFETIELNGKVYISLFETDEEEIIIPIKDNLGRYIYGISSYAFIGQSFKKLIIPKGIEDIRENAFIDCYNLEEVYLDNLIYKEINLDKCFINYVKNILFLVKDFPSVINYVSEDYMIMENNNIFDFPSTNYEETVNKIYITHLPNLVDIYIPDFYEGKEVSLSYLNSRYFKNNCLDLEKIRVPKNGFAQVLKISSLREICYSPLTTKIYLPLCDSIEKIILYEKLESFAAPQSPNYKNLKIFTIDDSISSLKHFYFKSIKDSFWYKNIIPRKDGSIVYKGMLFDLPMEIKNNRYRMSNDIVFIVNGLFEGTDLEEIIFNKKIKNISSSCFCNCSKLKNVFIPKNIEYIGNFAFVDEDINLGENCFKNIEFEDKDKIKIESGAFAYEETY